MVLIFIWKNDALNYEGRWTQAFIFGKKELAMPIKPIMYMVGIAYHVIQKRL